MALNVQTSGGLNETHRTIFFTAKEQAVLTRVSEGWTSQQIAHHLECSEGSVKATLQQLFKKLGVRKRAQIVRMAFEIPSCRSKNCIRSESMLPRIDSSEKQAMIGGDLTPQCGPEAESQGNNPIRVGEFVIDFSRHRVWIRETQTKFSPLEFELLTFFSKHPEELLSDHRLLKMLWGNPTASRTSLRSLIQALRAKIETIALPRYVVTQRPFGYRFIPAP